jgi:hypothetical protein
VHVHGADVVLALVLIGIPGWFTARLRVRRGAGGGARAGGRRGGPVSGWLDSRRALRLENAKHYNSLLRDAARHRHKLEEQEAAARARGRDRETAGGAPESPRPGGPRPRGGTVRGTAIRIRDERPRPAAGGTPPASPLPDPGPPGTPPGPEPPQDPPQPPEPPARDGGGSRPPSPRPAPGPNGTHAPEGSTVTTPVAAEAVPGVEQAVGGMSRVHAYAQAGNIKAKRRAMLALIVICERSASMALSMARALGEPGQHYGHDVTEPIAMGSSHLTAAASAFAQADGALAALLKASVEESMAAGRQMPHHDQLAETAAR